MKNNSNLTFIARLHSVSVTFWYSTAHVISSGINPESLRCPVTIRSESQATGVAYHELLALRSLANCFTFRWSLTTARRDGASLVNQMSTRSAERAPDSSNSISVITLFSISFRIVGTFYLFRSHTYMNILRNITYVAYDNACLPWPPCVMGGPLYFCPVISIYLSFFLLSSFFLA